jgi:hypothetical protein
MPPCTAPRPAPSRHPPVAVAVLGREYLHVPRQHYDVDVVLLQKRLDALLLLALVGCGRGRLVGWRLVGGGWPGGSWSGAAGRGRLASRERLWPRDGGSGWGMHRSGRSDGCWEAAQEHDRRSTVQYQHEGGASIPAQQWEGEEE